MKATALRMFIFLTIVTGLIYPLLITGIAFLTMREQANGSLIHKENRIIGSKLIAQQTTSDRYFWPRPSAIDYDPLKPSGGSNLGSTSKKLKEAVEERRTKLGNHAPSSLLYASGSGLDPHISLEAAYFQIPRIAKARTLNEEDLKAMVNSKTEGKHFGSPYVNVLLLNLALDGNKNE